MSQATPEEAALVMAQAEPIHAAEAVEAALDRMARELDARLRGSNPLLIGVLHGGLIPLAGLAMRLDFPLQLDYLHATRYRGQTRGGELHWLAHPTQALAGRSVVVVDDILDEGVTLTAILGHCREQGAAQVLSAVLVDKLHGRKPGIRQADFTGLTVPDRYVFGYGMDYRGYLRNARGIYAVRGL
jgi:hypoxanthine phosphoribosyltransferase